MSNLQIYFLVNLVIFFVALFINFRVRERGEVNMLEQFDDYRKRRYNPAEYIKNFYKEGDYQRDPNRGQHTSQSHTYVDIFAAQQNKPKTARQTANKMISQVTKGNPALEKAFRELQQEFQKKRQK